jgi:hypothetical protein
MNPGRTTGLTQRMSIDKIGAIKAGLNSINL